MCFYVIIYNFCQTVVCSSQGETINRLQRCVLGWHVVTVVASAPTGCRRRYYWVRWRVGCHRVEHQPWTSHCQLEEKLTTLLLMSVMITWMTNLCTLLYAFQRDFNVRCKTVSLTLEPLPSVTFRRLSLTILAVNCNIKFQLFLLNGKKLTS